MGGTNPLDLALAEVFRRQHGLVTRAQARQIGFSSDQIDYRLSRGTWVRADRGVYRHHLFQATWHSRVLAPCLALGAVASHQTAAALWNLDGFRPGKPEILLPKHSGQSRPGVRIHETTLFAERQATMRLGIPTTGIERTLIDLGKVVSYSELRRAIDSARLQELVDWRGVGRCFFTHSGRGRDGIGLLRQYLDDHFGEESVPMSDWSQMVSDLFVNAGLPKPELEYEVVGPGFRYRIDLAYPELRIGIELDSVAWHLNRESFEGDRQRLNRLQNLGWSMRLFTWKDFSDDPAGVVSTVRRAIAMASEMSDVDRTGYGLGPTFRKGV